MTRCSFRSRRLDRPSWSPTREKVFMPNHGQRVVNGLRLMQSASDLFLGWTEGREGRHFYIRQLHDMKIKLLVELFTPKLMVQYAKYCGWALARAHARAGQPSLIAGYLGKGDQFDEALTDFATAYAEQNASDYQALVGRSGKAESKCTPRARASSPGSPGLRPIGRQPRNPLTYKISTLYKITVDSGRSNPRRRDPPSSLHALFNPNRSSCFPVPGCQWRRRQPSKLLPHRRNRARPHLFSSSKYLWKRSPQLPLSKRSKRMWQRISLARTKSPALSRD